MPAGENSPRDLIDIYKAIASVDDSGNISKEYLIAEKVTDSKDWGKAYFDKADTYKYIFTKEDNRYVFTSVEIVK